MSNSIHTTKKVAFFLPSLRGGGAEKVMLSLADEFDKQSIDVELILVEKTGPYLKNVPDNIKVVDLECKRALSSFIPLYKYIRKNNPDVIISALTHINLIALLTSMCARKKTHVIVTEHSVFSQPKNISSLTRAGLRLGVRILYKKAKAIVAVSHGVAKDLAMSCNIPLKSIKVIYNPIDAITILKKANEQKYHPWLSDKKTPVLLSVSRLSPVKDLPTLIRAFKILRDKYEVKLIILGEGEERSRLIKYIRSLHLEEDIDFVGFSDTPYPYMILSDVLVLSSLHEGLPSVLIEAMACGTPVVSTDCPYGPAEILEHGRYGTLTPVGDAEALANAITQTLKYPMDPQRLKDRADDFSTDRAVKAYLKLIYETES